MDTIYVLIDHATNLVYGPYESFNEARYQAEKFKRWEIVTPGGDLIDWS